MNDRLLQDFAEIASDWFWETDSQHRFTFFSSRLEQVTGVPSKTFLGRSRLEIPQESIRNPKWVSHIEDLEARRPFRNLVYRAQRPLDGSDFWVRISGQPVFDPEGTFTGYRGTGTDITVEVEARQTLEQANAALSARNAELERAKLLIERLAFEDELTGLCNRRAMEESLYALAETLQPSAFALLIDLDGFKRVNDTLGHAAGDRVLCIVADRLRERCGDAKVGRMGGDEFLVLLSDSDEQAARTLATAIVSCIAQPIVVEGRTVPVGASVGVAAVTSAARANAQLLSCADLALYRAKEAGRNRAVVFTPELYESQLAQERFARELYRALENEEFEVWLQPQFNALSGMLSGAEALIRWRHPTLGLLAPDSFLPLAEDLGLLASIDRFVLRETLQVTKILADANAALPRVSVNISFCRLNDNRLVDDVMALWIDRRTQLSFELNDTLNLDTDSEPVIIHSIDRLREIGVTLEIDGFGTSHASIPSLLQLKPDSVKINRSLISTILDNENQFKLVQALIEIAQALGIETIAEGIESADLADRLNSLGCSNLQGCYLGRPVPKGEFYQFAIEQEKEPQKKLAV